jgi:hypothetical protein
VSSDLQNLAYEYFLNLSTPSEAPFLYNIVDDPLYNQVYKSAAAVTPA